MITSKDIIRIVTYSVIDIDIRVFQNVTKNGATIFPLYSDDVVSIVNSRKSLILK